MMTKEDNVSLNKNIIINNLLFYSPKIILFTINLLNGVDHIISINDKSFLICFVQICGLLRHYGRDLLLFPDVAVRLACDGFVLLLL